ncbi:MAG: lipocalin-like domain-containing protein [Rhodobacteraceae bacterium]|nr:lipocalin-like domain-containing protein [Paracoccaceae bacterium]
MSEAKDVLGTWEIRSWVVTYDDGTTDTPFGDEPKGFIHYGADGYMFAQFMGQGGHISYAGPYVVSGDKVRHNVVVCDRPGLVGTDLHRQFEVVGDNLFIRVARTTFGAREGSAVLTWGRAAKPALAAS